MLTLLLVLIIALIVLKALKIVSKMFFKVASIVMTLLLLYRLSLLIAPNLFQ